MLQIHAKDLDLPDIWPYVRLKSPKIENEALKSSVLLSLRTVAENPRQHEKVFNLTWTRGDRVNDVTDHYEQNQKKNGLFVS